MIFSIKQFKIVLFLLVNITSFQRKAKKSLNVFLVSWLTIIHHSCMNSESNTDETPLNRENSDVSTTGPSLSTEARTCISVCLVLESNTKQKYSSTPYIASKRNNKFTFKVYSNDINWQIQPKRKHSRAVYSHRSKISQNP